MKSWGKSRRLFPFPSPLCARQWSCKKEWNNAHLSSVRMPRGIGSAGGSNGFLARYFRAVYVFYS